MHHSCVDPEASSRMVAGGFLLQEHVAEILQIKHHWSGLGFRGFFLTNIKKIWWFPYGLVFMEMAIELEDDWGYTHDELETSVWIPGTLKWLYHEKSV